MFQRTLEELIVGDDIIVGQIVPNGDWNIDSITIIELLKRVINNNQTPHMNHLKKYWSHTLMVLFLISFIFSEKIKAISWLWFISIFNSNNLQVIWTLGSFIVAVIVGWIGFKFNKAVNIQNKLAFEEFRPKIIVYDLDPSEGRYLIKNCWDFEADNVILYSLFYQENEAKLTYKRKEIASSITNDQKVKILIDSSVDEYQTNILVYSNRASWIVYFNWYNLCTSDSESIVAVGEKFSNWNRSPMWNSTYNEITELLRITHQIQDIRNTNSYYSLIHEKLMYYFW